MCIFLLLHYSRSVPNERVWLCRHTAVLTTQRSGAQGHHRLQRELYVTPAKKTCRWPYFYTSIWHLYALLWRLLFNLYLLKMVVFLHIISLHWRVSVYFILRRKSEISHKELQCCCSNSAYLDNKNVYKCNASRWMWGLLTLIRRYHSRSVMYLCAVWMFALWMDWRAQWDYSKHEGYVDITEIRQRPLICPQSLMISVMISCSSRAPQNLESPCRYHVKDSL